MVDNNVLRSVPRLSVSTWSLHRQLGRPDVYGPESGQVIPTTSHGRGAISLLELPSRIAEFGIHTLEICHFHLPSREEVYLDDLRSAIESSGVELFSLLIDGGDVTHPVEGERDLSWIGEWIDTAGFLGATCARVIAGKAPPSELAMNKSRLRLQELARFAESHGVRLMTENWFPLLSTPEHVLSLLDDLKSKVGLCLDFGNWTGEDKYEDFRKIAPYAESCHAKAFFNENGDLDGEDYTRCLNLMNDAGFAGPYTLIYDGPEDDEWEGLTRERDILLPYVSC